MKLQTKISIKKQQENLIDYSSKIVLLGSCFSENIGNKLQYFKFQSTQNPFGIFFHPKAIEKFIKYVINEKKYTLNDIFFENERWHCFDAHSNLSSSDSIEILNNLNSTIKATKNSLKKTTHIIITLGTSWVYKHIVKKTIVANCHKVSQKKFKKELLTVDEISDSLNSILLMIKSINKNAYVIFTVSPIRHLKDGFIENTQSKSHLITAIHNVIESRKNTHYFPSYEIMLDELRDYRFYDEDMIHPNKTAINYIWEKFVFNWVSDESKKNMKEIEFIQKGLAHKPFNEDSEHHQEFLKKMKLKIEALATIYSHIRF